MNTPRLITNSDGLAVWSWDGEAFGNTPPNANPSGLGNLTFNLRFPGQYADAETGLFYNLHRDYDPNGGRYIESDPIGLNGGISTFAYVESNPLTAMDPTGLVKIPFYIPNNTVINFVKEKALIFHIDLSKCSDAEILDFVKFVPDIVANQFNDSYNRRPDAGTALTPAQTQANINEINLERTLITQEINAWLAQRKKDNQACSCVKVGA